MSEQNPSILSISRNVLFAGALAALVACGGSGNSRTPDDSTPDAFSFTAVTDADLDTTLTSSSVTVSGINTETPISITGGEYSIGSGGFTSAAGTITNGQSIRVQVESSSEFATESEVVLTIGEESASFIITTVAADITPDTFTFVDASGVVVNTTIESNVITVGGIEAPSTISVTGGEYSINSGDFVSVDGTVSNEQTVTVRGTSASTLSASVNVVLTIGGVSDTYTIATIEQDIQPDPFVFSPDSILNADLSSVQTSSEVIVAGINDNTAISVDGDTARYSINTGPYTDVTGTVVAGDVVTVQVTSPGVFSQTNQGTLNIGNESSSFSVTSLAADTTPAQFTFTDEVTPADFGTVVTSDAVTISDINTTTSISVSGGEYAIDGGDFTDQTGTIEVGQTVLVQAIAPSTYSTEVNVALTVGSVSDTFTFTSTLDDIDPTGSIVFPPPASMTEGDTVYVRGTAEDTLSGIASVKVNNGETIIDAVDTSDDGSFSTWEATVSVVDGDNAISLILEDAVANQVADAASVSVLKDTELGSFPDSNNPLLSALGLAIDMDGEQLIVNDPQGERLISVSLGDNYGERNIVSDNTFEDLANPLDANSGVSVDEDGTFAWITDISERSLFKVNIDDGLRTLVSSPTFPNDTFPFGANTRNTPIQHPNNTDLLLVADTDGTIFAVSKTTGERTVVSSHLVEYGPVPDTLVPMNTIREMVYDPNSDRLLLTSVILGTVFSVDLSSGERSVFSDSDLIADDGFSPYGSLRDVSVDLNNESVLLVDQGEKLIYSLDLDDASRSMFSSGTLPSTFNALVSPQNIARDNAFGYIFVSDGSLRSVFAIDIETGHRVIITK